LKVYSVVITTGGGFYRYKLNDLIKVKRFYNKVPLVDFLGKDDNTSDLFGEKVNEEYVKRIFDQLFKKYKIQASFLILAPTKLKGGLISYVCYIQFDKIPVFKIIKTFCNDFEEELRKNYHYDYCRKLGQLGKLQVFRVNSNGLQTYIKAVNLSGQKIGNIKLNILNKDLEWYKKFSGSFM